MENIDRDQVTQIIKILKDGATPEDPTQRLQLANMLEKADIIPRLYQAAYVESLYLRINSIKTVSDLEEKFKYGDDYFVSLIADGKPFDAVKELLRKAHDRQEDICDYSDTTLPNTITGRCQHEEHYEIVEGEVDLTEEEKKTWSKIHKETGWSEAWEHFEDKINPDNQELSLFLNYGSDDSKMSKDSGEYFCKECGQSVNENADGSATCDLENV